MKEFHSFSLYELLLNVNDEMYTLYKKRASYSEHITNKNSVSLKCFNYEDFLK